MWEVRVVVGFDPARGRSMQRSFTVYGDAALAGQARRELAAEYGSARSDIKCAASAVTVGELLEGYLGSAQLWKPATAVSHRHVVSALLNDPLCHCRLQSLTPAVMRAAICRWREEGMSVPKVSARWLLIRSAVSWAVAEGLLRVNPLAGMRGPPRPQPRRHHSLDEVRRLLPTAGDAVASAEDAFRRYPGSDRQVATPHTARTMRSPNSLSPSYLTSPSCRTAYSQILKFGRRRHKPRRWPPGPERISVTPYWPFGCGSDDVPSDWDLPPYRRFLIAVGLRLVIGGARAAGMSG